MPAIVESAKNRPLSYDPVTQTFILYDEIQNGTKKIVRLEKLTKEELSNLAVERQLCDDQGSTVILTGEVFTKKQLADEIKNQTAVGMRMFDVDINYLKFYLSQFPIECFESWMI